MNALTIATFAEDCHRVATVTAGETMKIVRDLPRVLLPYDPTGWVGREDVPERGVISINHSFLYLLMPNSSVRSCRTAIIGRSLIGFDASLVQPEAWRWEYWRYHITPERFQCRSLSLTLAYWLRRETWERCERTSRCMSWLPACRREILSPQPPGR